MAKQPPQPRGAGAAADSSETALVRSIEGFFDADWYQAQYPDIAAANLAPIIHFIRHGIAELRNPNRFFDCAWYSERYPDVSASGIHPLVHYLQAGAAELRNPHPNFDAVYYADQYPQAAANPLLYHIRVGLARGHLTEKPIRIQDYLPSTLPATRKPGKITVDVVIPVYRGLDETRRCVEAVLADPGKPLGRVIIVDDRSPEAELVAWLGDLAMATRIVLIQNPRNVGFVASVNRGMAAAGNHDVVLLNSDTEVPAGWLVRLTAQAYAGPRIATVSPLSNNATICGYPDDQGGPILLRHSLADVDGICRSVNSGRWVDAPTTVGFCMYIRRDALHEVGAFDAERFTVGYGEENDFCRRASALGWRHRIACDVFVYHKGSVSFGDRAAKLAARAMTLMLERHPTYQRDIARHVSLDDIAPYRFAVTAALFRQSRLPVILMIAHELGGGVRRHIDMLVHRFQDKARFLLLAATDRGAALSVPSVPNHPCLALPAERLDDLVVVLRTMNVSRIHIHHLLGIDMDIRSLIRRLDLPFDVTMHDYYAICPQINLLPWRHSLYCGEPDIAGCNTCIAHRSSHGARDILTWRADRAWQFRDAARVLCPSRDVMARLRRHGLAANAVFAPHEPVLAGPWNLTVTPPAAGKLRIAVLGTLVDHKGGRTVASVAELADPRTTDIHLIGSIDGQFSARALKQMKVTGPFRDPELAGLIAAAAPHLIWFPAAWPETFSYTLSAAIDAGAPIAATRIGAHVERLEGRPYTWLADIATSPAGWIDLFQDIRRHLADDPPGGARPLRPAVEDFYADRYLPPAAPSPPVQRHRRAAKPRIAIVPERFDIGFPTPCAYIRLLQPMHHPAVAAGCEVMVADAHTIFDHQADIILTQRYAIPSQEAANRLAAHARRIGAKLVFDLDDDLLDIPRNHPDAKQLRPRAEVVRRMLEVADHVWLSTPALAANLSALRPDAAVIENRLDERIWTPPPAPRRAQPVRILCMGTTTHQHDFEMIVPALLRLKAEYEERVAIDIIGMTGLDTLPAGLNRVAPSANAVRSYPGFVNWLCSVQPAWDIGLAPLLDSQFNHCKSAIKAMDYAALGLVVLASDMPVYRGSIADGPAGRLVPNSPAAWYAALDTLLRDGAARLAIASRSRTAFLDHASLATHARTWREAWMRLLEVRRIHAA